MPALALEKVTKTYEPKAVGVENLSLEVGDGTLLALVGPSGCGKTTTLRLIAGLEEPDTGLIKIRGAIANGTPPASRNVALMFQRPVLYPHRTIRDNLGFSLKLRQGSWWRQFAGRVRRQAIRERVNATSRMLGLDTVLDRYPAQLSGGQQQRVALGRALVRQPGVLLLDEPLSSLDAVLRQELRRELHLLQRQLQATMVYVTHDPVEALSLGDRVAVMERGHLHQVDRPEVLLQRPVNRFVAGFVGWPTMNFLDGELQEHEGQLLFVGLGGRQAVPENRINAWRHLVRRPLTLGIRPHDLLPASGHTQHGWPLRLRLIEAQSHGNLVSLSGEPGEITAWVRKDSQMFTSLDTIATGSTVMVEARLENCFLFDRGPGAATVACPDG
jgi:multiple sugar transport system ATP-binding protein